MSTHVPVVPGVTMVTMSDFHEIYSSTFKVNSLIGYNGSVC